MVNRNRFWISLIVAMLVVMSVRAQTDWTAEALANLQSSDPTVRCIAIGTLNQFFKDEYAELLIGALEDPNAEVRAAAANALGYNKVRRAVGSLGILLKDKNHFARADAARALARIGDRDAVPSLLDALETAEDFGARVIYIGALAAFDDPRSFIPLWKLRQTDVGAYALHALGRSSVEPLSAILMDPKQSDGHWHAVGVLKRVADGRAADALFSALGQGTSAIGRDAAEAIASRIGSPATDRLLLRARSTDQMERANALIALTMIANRPTGEATTSSTSVADDVDAVDVIDVSAPDPNMLPFYPLAMQEERYKVRLAQPYPNDARIVPAVLSGMNDKSEHVRRVAVESLANIDRGDVREALIIALGDPVMRFEASLALGRKKDPRAVSALIKVMTDQPQYSDTVSQLLADIGAPAVDQLIALLTDKNNDYSLREKRAREDRAKSVMFRCGNEPPPINQDPRTWAAMALGSIGDERARVPLTLALKDKADWMRSTAEWALKGLDKKQSQ